MVLYAKKPFAGPRAVLGDISRYTNRVAISNSRLVADDESGGTFRWKDYRDKGRTRYKTMTLSAEEFMRRFLLHVLLPGFHRIRHYGMLANIDLAIRVRPPPLEDSGLLMRVLSDRGQCLVASPALIERMGLPARPADLAGFPTMDLGQPQPEHMWYLCGPDEATAEVRHHPRYVTRAMLALRAAAVAGVGVVQLPRMMMIEQLAQGELVPVLSGWEPRREIIHCVYASRRGQLPAVRALIDFLVDRFKVLDED